jgi:hypothetical protein
MAHNREGPFADGACVAPLALGFGSSLRSVSGMSEEHGSPFAIHITCRSGVRSLAGQCVVLLAASAHDIVNVVLAGVSCLSWVATQPELKRHLHGTSTSSLMAQ